MSNPFPPMRTCFNPRAPAGRDLVLLVPRNTTCSSFNPRAPAGRDSMTYHLLTDGLRFQSTRPRGARHPSGNQSGVVFLFQSTRPRGARPNCTSVPSLVSSFNPRAPAGRDCKQCRASRCSIWFQSTRPRGARPASLCKGKHLIGFQSTRPRGARPIP